MVKRAFYKAEVERQQGLNREWQRVYLEAVGLLRKLGLQDIPPDVPPQQAVRIVFDELETCVENHKNLLRYVEAASDSLGALPAMFKNHYIVKTEPDEQA